MPTLTYCPRCGEVILHSGDSLHCPHCKWIGLKTAARYEELEVSIRHPELVFLCPSTRMYPIHVDSTVGARGFWPCNPSIVASQGELWLTVRLVSYKLDTRHKPPYRSHTLIHKLLGDPLETSLLHRAELTRLTPDNSRIVKEPEGKRYSTNSQGLEDLRLIPHTDDGYGSNLRGIACTCDRVSSDYATPQQATFWIDPRTGETGNLTIHSSPLPEKNWCPILGYPSDDQHYVYSLRPWTSVLREGPEGRMREVARYFYLEGQEKSTPMLSGSTQAIPFEDGYLMLAHERRGRVYSHRWVKLGGDLRPIAQSRPFYFRFVGIEFACGLAWAPVNNGAPRLLITFGVHDDEAWIASVLSKEVTRCLE